eukprot:CAMPEP_0119408874 /NCGR_PEP_ID=MMETSP1335-20130426/2288_1 /TAXON_ID=259385 /ORGANISM="Chrysoculter rhomboideus, Strain RCC1486" /LENGTH=794 /DNA_ID=CAMNT_0007433165 /DNA_START=49 /DNA_END=2434 /DNA_ORIENTATION=+
MAGLAWVDVLVVCVILLSVLAIGAWSTWATRNAHKSSDFFLGGRSMPWWAIGGSLFASNIGTEHFVGQAGSGAASGLPVSLYEWTAGWLIVLLGEKFAPVYLRALVTTVPEWLEGRFGKETRVLVSVLSLLSCIITKIAATLFAGAILLEVLAGWSLWTSTPIIIVTTGLYTIGGGLQAVMLTDVLQAVIFVLGGLAGMGIAMRRVGGWEGMQHTLEVAGLRSHLHMYRPADDASYPFAAMLTGQLVSSVWYWIFEQTQVQRVLAARSLPHARAGCVAAGYAKLLPPFMMVLPGIAARALFERCRLGLDDPGAGEGVGDEGSWCATRLDEARHANKAYPQLILREFPVGMVGVMVAAMVCAMMSSLSSNFNSASTLFTVDLYHRFISPQASERELLWCGRIATAAVCVLAMAWLPIVAHQDGEFYLVVQNATAHIAPAITVVGTLGVAWPRANSKGAFVGLLVGSAFGLAQYAVHLGMAKTCEAARVGSTIGGPWFACAHFLYVALVIAAVTLAIVVGVSLCTAPPPAGAAESSSAGERGAVGTSVQGPAAVKRQRSLHVQMMEGGAAAAGALRTEEIVSADAPAKARPGPGSADQSGTSSPSQPSPDAGTSAGTALGDGGHAAGDAAALGDVAVRTVSVEPDGAQASTTAWVESVRGRWLVHVMGGFLSSLSRALSSALLRNCPLVAQSRILQHKCLPARHHPAAQIYRWQRADRAPGGDRPKAGWHIGHAAGRGADSAERRPWPRCQVPAPALASANEQHLMFRCVSLMQFFARNSPRIFAAKFAAKLLAKR